MQLVVELEAAYVGNMSSPNGDVGWYDPWPYDPFCHRPFGQPFGQPCFGPMWYGPGPTEVHLLGGDGPVQAQLFRRELGRGVNRFQVPVRPGHSVTLSVQVTGGRQGWEAVGTFTGSGQAGQTVDLRLHASGPTMTVQIPAPAAPEPVAAPAPAAP